MTVKKRKVPNKKRRIVKPQPPSVKKALEASPSRIVKEWACMAHGYFESAEPVCPHGCDTVKRVFTKAPGVIGDKTKVTDYHMQSTADMCGNEFFSKNKGGADKFKSNWKPIDQVLGEQPKIVDDGKGVRGPSLMDSLDDLRGMQAPLDVSKVMQH